MFGKLKNIVRSAYIRLEQMPQNWSDGMIYIGCDPGVSGALAVIWPDRPMTLVPYSEEQYISILFDVSKEMGQFAKNEFEDGAICCLENVWAMPGQGVSATFRFGENFGKIQGILMAYHIPYELVAPQKWKRAFGATKDKNTSIAIAQRLFPDVNFKRTEKSRKPDDGLCEAALMALYAKRKF